jgi:hypothetical protein
MPKININDIGSFGKDEVGEAISHHEHKTEFLDVSNERKKHGKTSSELIQTSLEEALKEHETGSVIMVELPTETYFEANMVSAKYLIDNGFEGVYISFQRPFKNIYSLFKRYGIDLDSVLIIDGATGLSEEEPKRHPRCIHISSDIESSKLVEIIYNLLQQLKSDRKFVFIDSLTTMTLNKSLTEALKFSEFLTKTVREHEVEHITLLFNVAEDLSNRQFIKDIACYVDEVINVVRPIEQYVDEVISPDVLT